MKPLASGPLNVLMIFCQAATRTARVKDWMSLALEPWTMDGST